MPDRPHLVEEELLRAGQLLFDHILIPSPAVGGGLSFPLDSRWAWKFEAIRFLLSTDANAANRLVTVDLTDLEGTAWVRNPSPVVQAASVANQEYDFSPREFPVSGIAGAPIFSTLSQQWLDPGWQLRVTVANVQAGDQLSGIRAYVKKLIPGSL